MPLAPGYEDKPVKNHGPGDYNQASGSTEDDDDRFVCGGGVLPTKWRLGTPPGTVPIDPNGDLLTPDRAWESTTVGAGPGVWINIHADPEVEPAEELDGLDEMMGWATRYGHALTVLFSANWLEFLLDSGDARDSVAAWLRNGHRIGFHHHDVSHAGTWDGYNSAPPDVCRRNLKAGRSARSCLWSVTAGPVGALSAPVSPVSDAFQLMVDLKDSLIASHGATDSQFGGGLAASHGTSEEMREYEWQPDAVFSQGSSSVMINTPWCQEYGGSEENEGSLAPRSRVPEIGGVHFGVGMAPGVSVTDVLAELQQSGAGQYAGVSIHAWEYQGADADADGTADNIEILSLFEELEASGYSAQLMQDILEDEDPCGS